MFFETLEKSNFVIQHFFWKGLLRAVLEDPEHQGLKLSTTYQRTKVQHERIFYLLPYEFEYELRI